MDMSLATADQAEAPPVVTAAPSPGGTSGVDLSAVLAELRRLEHLADALDARLDAAPDPHAPS